MVIDLHSGGDVAGFALCATAFIPSTIPSRRRKIEETPPGWFGTPCLMIYQNVTPGLLPSEAERLGKITVGTELGWGSAVNTEGVRYGRQGVLAAAIHHGQLRGKIEPIGHHKAGTQRKAEMVDRDCFTVAPFAGHYEPLLECGAARQDRATSSAACTTSTTSTSTLARGPASTASSSPRPGSPRFRAASTLSSSAAMRHDRQYVNFPV